MFNHADVKRPSRLRPAAAPRTAMPLFQDEVERLRFRTGLFVLGDGLFLLLVSAVAAAMMHAFHELGGNLAFTLIVGMAVAMVLQLFLAIAAAPLLGSIESMVPSMIVAMLGPMAICMLELFGFQFGWGKSALAGVVAGVIAFAWIQFYGFMCRKSFRRAFPSGGQR